MDTTIKLNKLEFVWLVDDRTYPQFINLNGIKDQELIDCLPKKLRDLGEKVNYEGDDFEFEVDELMSQKMTIMEYDYLYYSNLENVEYRQVVFKDRKTNRYYSLSFVFHPEIDYSVMFDKREYKDPKEVEPVSITKYEYREIH